MCTLDAVLLYGIAQQEGQSRGWPLTAKALRLGYVHVFLQQTCEGFHFHRKTLGQQTVVLQAGSLPSNASGQEVPGAVLFLLMHPLLQLCIFVPCQWRLF